MKTSAGTGILTSTSNPGTHIGNAHQAQTPKHIVARNVGVVHRRRMILRTHAQEVTAMFGLFATAWRGSLAYVVKVRRFHELKSARQFPAPGDRCAQFEEVLKQLPGEQRIVVELGYPFKRSREDIVTILNCSVESVADLMAEGTKALKRLS
jgi:DNA-directed RNA polymerase specialized sigma24 family protein